MGVIVLHGSCLQGSCPQGSCPRGSCPRDSSPRTTHVGNIIHPNFFKTNKQIKVALNIYYLHIVLIKCSILLYS